MPDQDLELCYASGLSGICTGSRPGATVALNCLFHPDFSGLSSSPG